MKECFRCSQRVSQGADGKICHKGLVKYVTDFILYLKSYEKAFGGLN